MKKLLNSIRSFLVETFGFIGLLMFLIGMILMVPGGILISIGLVVEWLHDMATMSEIYDDK